MLLIAFSAHLGAAQTCPTSPSYSPDFSSNQNCLALFENGISTTPALPSFQPGGNGTLLQITPNSSQQRGYAWYTTPQPVGSSFSTTFTFQLTGASGLPADGFAFVIQNSPTGASTVGPTGSDGCGLGFGDDPSGNGCVAATGGITNSIAVGFKTFNSGAGFSNPDSVFIASNGTGPNCVDVQGDVISGTSTPVSCVIAENDLSGADTSPNSFGCSGSGICLADGNVHVVTITYALQPTASQSACYAPASNAPLPCLDVIIDGTDLFPTGVPFNMTSIGLTNNTAFVGFTGATGGSVENNDILSWAFTPQSFGNVNVCPSPATTPAPCSNTLPVTFSIPANTTIGSVNVVTQGVSGLDFSLANPGTCTGAVPSTGICTVNVTFTPLAPGLRMGAVNLVAPGSGPGAAPLATALIYGVGQGPAIAFGPGTQSTVYAGAAYNGMSGYYAGGAAVDAAGNLFIAENQGTGNNNGLVVKVAPNNTQTIVGSGLEYPQGLAVDGAGDVYIADNNLNEVVEVTPAGVQTEMNLGLVAQLGVAVDGAGDLFVSSFNDNEVVERPANGGAQTVVYSPGSSSNPIGLALDAAGDLFIADFGLQKVVEIQANGGAQTTVGTGWLKPESVAVDAAGDVFVADETLGEVEVPAGCTNNLNNCQITVSGILSYGVAVDGKGDAFIPDLNGNKVDEINRSQPPSLSFAATYQGSTTDSPQVVSVENIGNATLDLATISFPLDFQDAGGENDCATGTLLTPGLVCPLTIDFTPTVEVPPLSTELSESVTLSDNALNVTGATQSISVQGTALSPQVAVPAVLNDTLAVATSSITGLGLTVSSVTSPSSTVPVGEVISQSPSAGTLVTIQSSVSLIISSGVTVPNVVNQMQTAAGSSITGVGLVVGTVTMQYSDTVPFGTVISQSPDPGTTLNGGLAVSLVVSNGTPPPQDQLAFENNYFVTGDYATAGVTLHGVSSGIITMKSATPCAAPNCGPGVPDGADIIDGFLYWTTIETSATPSGNTGTFLGYSITGEQIGSDVPNYSDGSYTGTLRVYRADVNNYFQVPSTWNGARQGSGQFAVSLPNSNGTITEGASLVEIYRVLSPLFPLKSVVIYNGSIAPASLNASQIPQAVKGFYDAVGGANGTGEVTHLYTNSSGGWADSESSQTLGQSNQYIDTLSAGNAYAAVILSTPVNNSDNDGILDAWKAAQGYTDVMTGAWVPLPGATQGEKDLFVQFDYMCSAITGNNTCDFTKPNLYPSPDAQGNDPLAMVTQAFANYGVHLHLKPGNAVSESTCTDSATQFCEFPNQPGVVAWNGSVELSKVWPANFAACTATPSPATCAPRFPYGQKDSYHYVLFGYSLAIPAWTTRAGSITSITTTGGSNGGTGTIVTTGLGTTCPTRITVSGVQGNPNLNAIYDKTYNNLTCDSGLTTLSFSTPSNVPAWTYPNTLQEPVIAVTSGKVTSISGYSDLGGSDSVVSLGQWESSPTQDMSKAATVVAGTLFHEIGHTLGLSHGGLYFDTPQSYIPTFEANCKPNYQSSMNYLFQLDGVGPNGTVTYSNQALYGEPPAVPGAIANPIILGGDSSTSANFTTVPFGSVVSLTDQFGNPASFTTSAWYTTTPPSSTASPATTHCDGSPLTNDTAYRVTGPVDSISPAWTNGQNITFDGAQYSDLRGFNDTTALDLRQVGATSGDFASLASETSYGNAGVTFAGSGGVTFAGSGGVTFAGSGGVTFAGSGGVLFAGSGGVLFAGSGGVTFAGSGGVTFAGSGGVSFAGSGGVTFAGSGGVTFAGSGGVTFAGSGGASTNELDYLTANSIVRPPNSPTITPVLTNGVETSVILDWTAPVFGVVQSYTVYRSPNPNGSNPIQIGVVNGVGGLPPATEFIDSNPLNSSTVIYTISTTLAPVQIDPTQRSSPPSVPAIVKSHQTIVLGPLQSSVTYSTSMPPVAVTATAESNSIPNGLQVNFVATGPCSVSGQTVASIANGGASTATVAVNNPGSNPATCSIVASQPGTNPTASSTPPYYDAANSVSESFTIEPENSTVQAQTISWATLPNVPYGSTFPLIATAETNNLPDGLPVIFSALGPCTTSGATIGVGPCTITASQAGDSTHSPATVSQSFNITPAVLTVTANNLTAPYGTTPTLTYTIKGFVNQDQSSVVSGTPALSTTATQGSSPGSYPIMISTGSLAAANYSFLFANGTLTIASGPLLTVTPTNIPFGLVTLGSITTRNITVSNIGTAPATISNPILSIVQGGNSNEFVAVSLCPSPLAVGKSCTITIAFVAGPFYTPQSATLDIMDNAPLSPQLVTLSATVLMPQTITLSGVPATAAYNSNFKVTATGGASGIPLSFTSSGACSNVGATYTMTSGTGTCSVIVNQAGNLTYAPASQVTKTVSATPVSQTITITPSSVPASAAYKSTFTVAATASSGLGVTFTSSGACGNSGSTYTITSGSGTCSVIANQAGNSNFTAAPQVIKTVSATKASQTISFTVAPPATAAYKTNFTVTATASSALGVTYTSSGACSNSGATYTMTSGTGSCSVIVNQAGNSNYAAATQITQNVTATQAAQTIAFTTNAPASAAYKSTFKVAATGGASGNAVTFTSSGACSNSGATYTMTSGTGSCSVIANQAGNSNYAAASPVTETVTASLVAQAISFTTNPPASANLNTSFTVAATGGGSGIAVTFTSSGSCTNSGAKYTITSATGTCSVIANQAGNSNYAAAPPVTKTVTAK
jgi:MBG domain (YGX type)/Bacterial lectin/PASTA domain